MKRNRIEELLRQNDYHNIRQLEGKVISCIDRNKNTVSKTTELAKLKYLGLISPIVLFIGVGICYWCMGNSSSSSMASPVVIPPRAAHRATLIFLHGLGDTGKDGVSILGMSLFFCNVYHFCYRFDIFALSPNAKQDEEGIKKASQDLKNLILEEGKSIGTDKVFIGGFSQGGAVALYTALTSNIQLAGLVGLSTWLPLHSKFTGENSEIEISKHLKDMKVFQGHGQADPLVSFPYGQMTSQILESKAAKVTFKAYPEMGHSSCPQEMQDIKAFLESVIPRE
ncbi:acyl-protein thioesterase 1-like [Argopecten irradians]|uniref:acyl-protein thioesterase 1-like n=1 Tax=Argopecten irradians TaxID=31199 RepID=UPI00371F56EC